MIKNKQVNLWRGPDLPPTNYHIWLKNESLLLRYDEESNEWVVFLDSRAISQRIQEFMETLDTLANFTVNGKLVKDNPILDARDILTEYNGNYIKSTDTLQRAVTILDGLLTTKIYNGL